MSEASPCGRALSLNSKGLTTPILQQIAKALDISTTGSLADTRQMLEGKLSGMEREPRDVQIFLRDTENGVDISLQDAYGEFLRAEMEEKETEPVNTQEEEGVVQEDDRQALQ